MAEITPLTKGTPEFMAAFNDARAKHTALHLASWSAYSANSKLKTAESAEAVESARADLDRHVKDSVALLAPPSDCRECRVNGIFGGPGHQPSSCCRSGKRPHCTCVACF